MTEPDLSGLGDNEARMWRLLFAALRPGDVFLDIGADRGGWAVPAALAGAEVYAVEAGDTARLATAAREAGVGDRVRVARAAVLDADSGSHAVRPDADAVPVVSIDGIVHDLGLGRVDFVKIDIEGYELRALDGARDTLARLRPAVMVEVHYDGGWGGVPVSVLDVTARLPGYRVEVAEWVAPSARGAHVLAVPEAKS